MQRLNRKSYQEGESVLKGQNKTIENLSKVNEIYELKVGNMYVEMAYNENEKRFNECILNILKKKVM